jgi:uncharacterized RDD family membrane protein YckC
MNPNDQQNPYAAPTARVDDVGATTANEVAARGTRLAAAIIDSLMWVVPIVIMVTMTNASARNGTPSSGGMMAFLGLWVLVIAIVNLTMVFQSQQTIGKKICSIRIVRFDGSPCNPWRIILLRGVVMGLLGAIPFIGRFMGLVDALMIFRDDNRCLHDHIADTIVVRA